MADERFEEYLRKVCESDKISREEALKRATVQEVKKYYESNDTNIKAVGWKEE